jgi:hypothetical protein
MKFTLDRTTRWVVAGVVGVGLAGIAGSEHHARRLIQKQFLEARVALEQLERRFGEVMTAHEQLMADLEGERRRASALEQALASAKADLERTSGRLAEESRNSRTLQMRLSEMQQQLDQVQGELALTLKQDGGPSAASGAVQIAKVVVSDESAPPSAPSGRVISIHRDWDFVVINLGWDAVRIGDVVSIFRNEQLQAKAKIERVQEGVCAATVLPDWKTDALELNDLVRVL